MKTHRWSELSIAQRRAAWAATAIQLALAAAAWADLAKRPGERVNGPKFVWAAIIGVNFLGPIAYFARGRRTEP